MYRGFPAEVPQRPAGFGSPSTRGPPNGAHFSPRAAAPRLPPGGCGPSPGSTFTYRPMRDHYLHTAVRCSSFPIDRSTGIPPHNAQQHPILKWGLEAPPKDNSERAGEEFLRCIAANKPLPEYLKGNMAYNLADALKSASTIKAVVASDSESSKHMSRSRSRSHTRAKRAKSSARSKTRARSKSHARSRSRGKSRARSKSRGRSKRRTQSKSRPRSRSRGKSQGRHKSRARSTTRAKSRSRSPPNNRAQELWWKSNPGRSCSAAGSTGSNALIQGLKLVMNSKELDDRLPSLKDAILTIQASSQGQDTKVDCVPIKRHLRSSSHHQEDPVTREHDSMLLPHERVGNDFSWLQLSGLELSNDRPRDNLEDEESFLYGDVPEKQTTAYVSQTRQLATNQYVPSKSSPIVIQQQYQQNPMFKNLDELFNLKPPPQVASNSSAATVEPEPSSRQEPSSSTPDIKDCEKLQGMLTNMGFNLGTMDINKLFVKMEEKDHSPIHIPKQTPPVFPALGNTNARQALETLQSLIKATKEKRTQSNVAITSQLSSDKHKANGNEEARRREKRTRIQKMESLMKDLEGLLQEDGNNCLTPVIGFYCKKCEEFIGDLNTAENHKASHSSKDSSSPPHRMDGRPAGDEPRRPGHHATSSSSRDWPSHHPYHQHPAADGRDLREPTHHRDPGGLRGPHRDHYGLYVHSDGKHGPDPRGHHPQELPEKHFLKEEIAKERLLITVARGRTPPPKMPPDEDKSQAVAKPSWGQPEPKDSGNALMPAKGSSSSSSEDNEKDRSAKTKTSKKKKKEKKKKEKKEKKKRNEKDRN